MKEPQDNEFDGSEIAICGMAARFPGASDIAAFWENLKNGVDSISHFTNEEVLAAGEDPDTAADPNYVPARAVLDGVELFDAGFFGFTPREAEILDPQARVLLECAWEALEEAGYDTQRFQGSIGLFAGASFSTYLAHHLYKNRAVMKAFGDVESTMFNIAGAITTMTSYKLNLRGVGCSVQTFCSTSLVAVHLACQSLLNYESDIALAGGVTVQTPQTRGYVYREGGIVSTDGRCRPFDANASGTVFGSGAGIVALRRLKDALADRDPIHAIIRGSAARRRSGRPASTRKPSAISRRTAPAPSWGIRRRSRPRPRPFARRRQKKVSARWAR
jgi:acyl transferase domain-containing protein